jgi:hypothetical protein
MRSLVRSTALAVFVLLQFMALGCDIGGDPTGSGGSSDPLECESYPLGEKRDPAALPSCCPEYGAAHCLPSDVVPAFFQDLVDTCSGGGFCVPDKFIESGGVYVPKDCVSLGQADGVCLSACVPQVAEFVDLLPTDVCDPDERCVPCVNPLDNTETGACLLRQNSCDVDLGAIGEDGETSPTQCPHEGPPLLDPATFPACGVDPESCSDASCVPTDLVPDSFRNQLAACDPTSLCVPNEFVRSAGNTIPESCASVAGFEGRCLSRCLPDVAAQADLLPQATCPSTHLCAPCYDPLSGAPTGACELSCDPGPQAATEKLESCCQIQGQDIGACIPPELAGDQADNLRQDTCSSDEFLCVPVAIAQETFVAQPCTASGLLGFGSGPGACLPGCLAGLGLTSRDDCPADYKCAPCKGPFGGDTGACDFLP